MPGLETVAKSLRKRAAGFLREHVGKVEALHPDARVLADVAGRLRERVRAEKLLDGVAGAALADRIVAARILAADQFTEQTAENLAADLRELTGPFRRQSEVIGKSAGWLRWGATPLTHLVAPIVGHAIVAGVYLTGIGYVAYALTDRIDARDLGIADRVDGVVRIVEARTRPARRPSRPQGGGPDRRSTLPLPRRPSKITRPRPLRGRRGTPG